MMSTPIHRARALFLPTIYSRADLLALGMTRGSIARGLRSGRLLRLRRDRYARAGVDDQVSTAARIGGRLTCLTLLRMLGVFVLAAPRTHVEVHDNRSRFDPSVVKECRVHWSGGDRHRHDLLHVTRISDAVLHSLRCQAPRAAVASLDSVVHHGLLTRTELERLFVELPARFRAVLRLVDGTAESGPETFVRLMLRTLGVSFSAQVLIAGVGRVDFVVDGWLIVECDSKEFHEGWEKQKEDRRRDLAALRLGYVTVRPLATDILHDPGVVQDALRAVIEGVGPRFTAAARS